MLFPPIKKAEPPGSAEACGKLTGPIRFLPGATLKVVEKPRLGCRFHTTTLMRDSSQIVDLRCPGFDYNRQSADATKENAVMRLIVHDITLR
jgi:hypothetical protein